MKQAEKETGWTWFETRSAPPGKEAPVADDDVIRRAFRRCFRGPDADVVLGYLKSITTGRVLGPDASDSMLRYLEGQRALLQHIDALIERGQG